MNCQPFQQLSIKEKTELIGELVHVVQSSEHAFLLALEIIDFGKRSGFLDDVKVGAAVYEENSLLTTT